MMKCKRLGALSLAIVLALSALSGCGGQSPGSTSGAGGSSGSSASGSGDSSQVEPMDLSQVTDPYLAVSGLPADEVVITVGDMEVAAADYLYWLNQVIGNYLSQFGGAMSTLPWDVEMAEGLTFGQYMLDQAADTAVLYSMLRQMAQAEGLSTDSSGAIDEYADLVLQLDGDETRATHILWANMLTRDLLTKLSENRDLYPRLQELYYGENSGHYPTDAEVNAYLDEKGCFHVKHILLMTVDQATNEPLDESEIAQKKATADDLLAQLQAAEDPIALFDQLMNEYSEDGGLATNPDGYVFDDTDSLVGGFREATLALAVGEISDVVETDYGYHIMLRLPIDPADYRDEYVIDLLEARIDAERDRLGVTRTAAFDKLDVESFWNNVLSLQSAVQAELAG